MSDFELKTIRKCLILKIFPFLLPLNSVDTSFSTKFNTFVTNLFNLFLQAILVT